MIWSDSARVDPPCTVPPPAPAPPPGPKPEDLPKAPDLPPPRCASPVRLAPRRLLTGAQRDRDRPELELGARRREGLVRVAGPQCGDLAPRQYDDPERVADPQPVRVGVHRRAERERHDQRYDEDHAGQREPRGAAVAGHEGVDAEPADDGQQQDAAGDARG
jgi:hypothetical protein